MRILLALNRPRQADFDTVAVLASTSSATTATTATISEGNPETKNAETFSLGGDDFYKTKKRVPLFLYHLPRSVAADQRNGKDVSARRVATQVHHSFGLPDGLLQDTFACQ